MTARRVRHEMPKIRNIHTCFCLFVLYPTCNLPPRKKMLKEKERFGEVDSNQKIKVEDETGDNRKESVVRATFLSPTCCFKCGGFEHISRECKLDTFGQM